MASSSRHLNRGLTVVPPADATVRIIGTGEMADLIRAFDWTKTAIGGVDTWSDTLVTTVNLLLASRHPMFLWWGPELIQFYNDGYRPSLRADKHPTAVGQRGTECWPEIWTIIGPQIEAVMARGESSWNTNQLVPINRNGKLEEVFWTYSYSPVRDKNGEIQGTLVVCSETTEQVLMERRLRTLLTISLDASARIEMSDRQALRRFSESVAASLQQNPADFPFASLFLLRDSEILQADSPTTAGALSLPSAWPLAEVIASGTPLLLEDLAERFGKVILPPWPEPVTRAFLLPLRSQKESLDAVFVFGLSPRLPFDDAYRTFCQLVGARIASLLESEAHQLELALAARRFTRLAEENPFGMVIGNLEGQLQYANSTFLKTLGYTQADVREGKLRWNQLTPPEYADADAKAVQQIRESGRCDVYEKAYIAKDGRLVPILIGASVIDPSAHEEQVAAFVTDLTPLKQAQEALRTANDALEKKIQERTYALANSVATLEAEIEVRKKTEQQLRELSARVLRLQDEEHRRIARDLHDSTGQTLTALKMTLASLGSTITGNPRASRMINDLDALAGQALQEIRTLSHLLHPPMLDEVGFSSAAQWYVDEFTKRSGIRTSLRMTAQPSLTKDAETALFRVLQESLTNVVRHSGSTSVDVLVYSDASDAILSVRDYGKGIPSDKLKTFLQTAAGVGVGLGGMKQRMRDLGGHLRVDCDGTGTCIVATLPLSRA